MTNFVDWLSISQQHRPGILPIFGSDYNIRADIESGEIKRSTVVGYQHEGSYDSSLQIRSDGFCVSVSGNPSAFSRPDNLFGFTSVSDALDCVNFEVFGLGLPVLTSARNHEELESGMSVVLRRGVVRKVNREYSELHFDISSMGRTSAHSQTLLKDGRARISRVDITENLSTSGAVDFIRHLSSYFHHGRAGNLHPNGRTVDWGQGSRRIYTKYYDKAYSIGLRIKELQSLYNHNHNDNVLQHLQYLEKLKHWCEEFGIVRRETTFKSTEIIDRNLSYIEQWDNDMDNIIRPYQFHKKLHLTETTFTGVSGVLQSKGIKKTLADKAELIHTSWVNGADIKSLCGSESTYYRNRRILLLVGVDIFTECDISRLPLRVIKSEWKDIESPSWYVCPSNPKLKLVA